MYYIDFHPSPQLDCKPLWGIILTLYDFAQGIKVSLCPFTNTNPFNITLPTLLETGSNKI